jgi:hypothetical protein
MSAAQLTEEQIAALGVVESLMREHGAQSLTVALSRRLYEARVVVYSATLAGIGESSTYTLPHAVAHAIGEARARVSEAAQ